MHQTGVCMCACARHQACIRHTIRPAQSPLARARASATLLLAWRPRRPGAVHVRDTHVCWHTAHAHLDVARDAGQVHRVVTHVLGAETSDAVGHVAAIQALLSAHLAHRHIRRQTHTGTLRRGRWRMKALIAGHWLEQAWLEQAASHLDHISITSSWIAASARCSQLPRLPFWLPELSELSELSSHHTGRTLLG